MNTHIKLLFTLLFCTLLISCSISTTSENENSGEVAENAEIPKITKKDLSELTYRDVIDVVFKDQGEGIEWHSEDMPNSLTESIAISSEGICGAGD